MQTALPAYFAAGFSCIIAAMTLNLNTLHCMPLPARVNLTELAEADQPPPRAAQSGFFLTGSNDLRLQAVAAQMLDGCSVGELHIAIADESAAMLPHLYMDEAYTLAISDNLVELQSASVWGGLRGIATLAQLAQQRQLYAGLKIQDAPRFAWRGLSLDVARHFFPLASLTAVVDGLAALKMNVLHLHLSDDQAFRFPSTAYPSLASEQHYTVTELKELVGYAADRGIRVVPELDVPGHVTAWLVAYPQWGSGIVSPTTRFGVHKGCLNPLDESVYEAIDALLDELGDIFPDEYIHVGGDEVSPTWWQEDDAIGAYLREQQMSAQDLQNVFLRRVCSMVSNTGKQAVAWDEVLHRDMPECVVQNWRGATTRDRALALSMPVLVSAPYYLDLNYPADLHYGFDPEATQSQWLAQEDALQDDPRLRHVADGIEWTKQWRAGNVAFDGPVKVLGGEACLWSELVVPEVLPTRLWSRLPVVAERLWSPAECTNNDDMYQRLQSCWRSLPEDPEALCMQNLHKFGCGEALTTLVALLEPVKWYGRLLGEQALQARLAGTEMPKARPYQVDTPLNRVADFLLPESMAARRLNEQDLVQGADRVVQLYNQAQHEKLPQELCDAVEALLQGAEVVLAASAASISNAEALTRLQSLDVPYGEYIAAPLHYWRAALGGAEFA